MYLKWITNMKDINDQDIEKDEDLSHNNRFLYRIEKIPLIPCD